MVANFSIQDWFDGRADTREAFLQRTGWGGATRDAVGEDCAFRRYIRLHRGDRTAILMETVPDGHSIATPGHSLSDFIRIGATLRDAGLHTPEVFHADPLEGYLLLEDFGDLSFKKAIAAGHDRAALYGLATDVLVKLRDLGPVALPFYKSSHVHEGRRRIIDWYFPALFGVSNLDGLAEEYLAVWDEIERGLPPCPQGFLHIDYHVENLMLIEGEQGLARCGILDFQGAMRGPLPYDLANLLEDARLDIPPELRAAMLERYAAGLDAAGRESLMNWYRVLATQFHCRVAGQFIRIALLSGKDRYLQYLPRVTAYLRDGISAPVLLPLRRWFAAQGVDFAQAPDVDIEALRPLIREDAF